MNRKQFGLKLKFERKKQGMKLDRLAHEVGLKNSAYISRIENGLQKCSLKLAFQIIKVLGLDINETMGELRRLEHDELEQKYKNNPKLTNSVNI